MVSSPRVTCLLHYGRFLYQHAGQYIYRKIRELSATVTISVTVAVSAVMVAIWNIAFKKWNKIYTFYGFPILTKLLSPDVNIIKNYYLNIRKFRNVHLRHIGISVFTRHHRSCKDKSVEDNGLQLEAWFVRLHFKRELSQKPGVLLSLQHMAVIATKASIHTLSSAATKEKSGHGCYRGALIMTKAKDGHQVLIATAVCL